jgi:hypothetical protein
MCGYTFGNQCVGVLFYHIGGVWIVGIDMRQSNAPFVEGDGR